MNVKLTRTVISVAGILLVAVAAVLLFIPSSRESVGDEDGLTAEVAARGGDSAVVSSHELATQAGADVLEAGGSAADAAVAVASALSIVEPWFSSVLGGGTWALYYDAESGEITSMDGVGPAGSKASASDFAERAGDSGMHQAVVPGAWDGWMLWLEEYGRLELEDILSPAIDLAEEGFPASPGLINWLGIDGVNSDEDAFAYSAELYEGVEAEGDTVYQRSQARTLRDILSAWDDARSNGRTEAIQAVRDYVYRGPVAEAIVDFSDEHGGYLTLDDFHSFEAQLVDPISIDYNGIEVLQNPPNSQGITQLMLLNILKDYDFNDMELDSADAVHLQVEATKLAFADRYYHVGDPDFVDVPVETLLSDEHAARRRESISMDSVLEWPIDDVLSEDAGDRAAAHTTTFHVVDEDGNAASVTTSLGAQYLVAGETGIHMNNRMRMIAVDEGDPNRLEPGKKVRHTSNPYIAMADGKPYILGGNTGVDTQPQGQAQQFLAVVEFGADPQEAVSRKRFISRGFPATSYPYSVEGDVQFEGGFDESVKEALSERGHRVSEGGVVGSANMLVIDPETGEISAGADPRDGVAGSVIR